MLEKEMFSRCIKIPRESETSYSTGRNPPRPNASSGPVQCNYFLFYCASRLRAMNLIVKNGRSLPGRSVTASNAELIIWESG